MLLDPAIARKIREDTLHVGATRPARLLGLPMPLAIALGGLAYMIQTNVTGWRGALWAAAITGPVWVISFLAVARDPYGINVGLAWLRTAGALQDKSKYGGPSLSPLPARQSSGGMYRVQ
jgi:type IV secretory pathway VirB3-like protein